MAREGRLLAHVCYRSVLRLAGRGADGRATQGAGIVFEDVTAARPEIRDFVRELVAARCFSGQIAFDFIRDERATYVIECNPRATSGVHLFGDDDALAEILLGAAESRRVDTRVERGAGEIVVEPPRGARPRTRKLGFALPFAGALAQGEVRAWPSLLRHALGTPDVVYRRDDPMPALAAPLSLAELALVAARERRPLTAATTYDIEYDGQPLPDA